MGDLKHYITDTDLHIVPFPEIQRDFTVDDGFQASNMGAEEKMIMYRIYLQFWQLNLNIVHVESSLAWEIYWGCVVRVDTQNEGLLTT